MFGFTADFLPTRKGGSERMKNKSVKTKLLEEIKETKRLRRVNKTEYGRGYLAALKIVLEWVK